MVGSVAAGRRVGVAAAPRFVAPSTQFCGAEYPVEHHVSPALVPGELAFQIMDPLLSLPGRPVCVLEVTLQ